MHILTPKDILYIPADSTCSYNNYIFNDTVDEGSIIPSFNIFDNEILTGEKLHYHPNLIGKLSNKYGIRKIKPLSLSADSIQNSNFFNFKKYNRENRKTSLSLKDSTTINLKEASDCLPQVNIINF